MNVFDYKGPNIIKMSPEYKEPTSWLGVVIQIGASIVVFYVLCSGYAPMLQAGGVYDVPGQIISSVLEFIGRWFPW